jgi:hypothetical protein
VVSIHNGVERANCSAKSGGHKPSLYAAMQSLYEKDKMFALQYIAAEDGSKITYRSPLDEEQRSQAAVRRRQQKMIVIKMHLMDPLISMSILKILIRKRYSQEVREGKWILRTARKTMKTATLHPVIEKMLKYCMLMECGIEDGYRSISKQENGL